jgi:hypothetical protein
MDTVGPALQSLLDDAEALMAACGRPVGVVHLAPGNTVSWDDCEDCNGGGRMWARLVSVLPQPQSAQPCDITDLQVRMALGAVRCMHGLSEEGGFPTAAQMVEDTLKTTADADTMLRAIRQWEGTRYVNLKSLMVEQGLPLGPQGYCGGFEWTLKFRVLQAVTAEGC